MRSPRLKPCLSERPGDADRHGIELEVGVLGRHLLAAEIDDRDLGEIAIAPDQVAEILELRHYGSSDSRYADSAIMSS